jgi:hypothetical protein
MSDLMNFAVSVLSSLTVSGFLTATLVWFAKSTISERIKNSIKSVYDEKLETHKAQLKADSDREIEKLRASLQLLATEHQVRFAGLYAKRADTIAESYDLLVTAFDKGAEFASPAQARPEDFNANYLNAMAAIQEFYKYFDRNRIYLPATLCARIVPLVDQMRGKVHVLGSYGSFDVISVDAARRSELMTAWSETWSYFTNEFAQSREQLENEFRKLLGDAA